tara:strand:+ start:138 stop:530 length:393 start_codon:yes stop_codon:yes gene_type:complete
MFIISFVLNLITILVVGTFALVIYMAYRKRPDLTSSPLDVMRDIVAGHSGPTRLYKIHPFKRLLTGPVGEFGNYSDKEFSDLKGNTYDHVGNKRPWEGVQDVNFGSSVGVSKDDLIDEVTGKNTFDGLLK